MSIVDFTNKTIREYYFTPNYVTFVFSTGTKVRVEKERIPLLLVGIIKSDADDDCIFRNKKVVEQIIIELP